MACSAICFLRLIIYLCKRTDVSLSKDQNVLLAVGHIQEYVTDNELSIVVDNRNCDFILQHLSNFIQLSKSSNYREQVDHTKGHAQKLQCISIKFQCTLYHKIYKEEILKLKHASCYGYHLY